MQTIARGGTSFRAAALMLGGSYLKALSHISQGISERKSIMFLYYKSLPLCSLTKQGPFHAAFIMQICSRNALGRVISAILLFQSPHNGT